MDNALGSLMEDVVAADAARLSGREFADARGAGVARRVRTRRTVRAAGMGGASAVAAGVVAFGATHAPWDAVSVPGAGGNTCATPWPSDSGIMLITAGPRPLPTDTTWWIGYENETGIAKFKFAPLDDGTWLIAYASGGSETVTPTGAGTVSFELPDGVRVVLEVTAVDGRTEVTVAKPSSVVLGSGSLSSDDCYISDPAPSTRLAPAPGSVVPGQHSPAPSVWLTAGTELVQLYGLSEDGALVTLRRSEGFEQLRLDEYTVVVADGVARVRVGDKVVRIRVDSEGIVTVIDVESAGFTAPLGEPTSTAIDPWFWMGDPVDVDALAGW